ncbi:MAG: primosomal protein N' [Thermodesulfobacteriota bacterium]
MRHGGLTLNKYAEIAVNLPVDRTFSYAAGAALKGDVAVGKRVLVPFGRRTVTGYVVALKAEAGVDTVKDIIDVLDSEPLFDSRRLKFLKWIASYYQSPLGMVLSLVHPPGADVKSRRFLIVTEKGFAAKNKKGLQGKILEAVGRARSGLPLPSLIRRFKRSPVYSTIERLKREGLLAEELRLTGGRSERKDTFLTPLKDDGKRLLLSQGALKNSPLQERIFNYLLDTGGVSLKELKKKFGGVYGALKGLEKKGLIAASEVTIQRDPLADVLAKKERHDPNDEQARAIREIVSAVKKRTFSPYLLYGVTGSGKTLVYLNVLEEVVSSGGRALFLVPEITLTPWPAAYLKERFPGRVAVAHSGLTAGERIDEWRRIAGGRADIIVGTRSALFSPVKDLSLIIVDEEHDPSYKQEEGVRYNGRDAAIVLGKHIGATVLLGSATPSVETFYNSKTGKITPLFLTKRVEDRPMPEVEVIDMRGKKGVIISERLSALMKEALDNKNQSMLFLNRRGFSGCLVCRDCGHTFSCPNCSVSLTLHKRPAEIKCHYCDFSTDIPGECPECRGFNLIDPGVGTEKVEEEVKRTLPGARVVRMDMDTARKKGAVKSMIDDMEKKRADVLVGTQMVSKGHHFPGITLAGIISGDTSLNIPDFRSPERTFQLVTQAAGRAGRGLVPGTVVIQTLNRDHYCFKHAASHDYESFYSEEIEARRDLNYPPFTRLACLRVDGNNTRRASGAALRLQEAAHLMLKKHKKGIELLGPAPSLVARVRGRHRFHMLVKGADPGVLHNFIRGVIKAFEARGEGGVTLTVDIDPLTVV